MRLVVILLAAGKSRRYGSRDKLLAPLHGRPLVSHALQPLAGLRCRTRIVVLRDQRLKGLFRGWQVVSADPRGTQGASLSSGLRAARRSGATHALVLLGDMPGLLRDDLADILRGALGHPVMAKGRRAMPPALIPRALFPRLLGAHRDEGAGSVLRKRPDLVLRPLAPGHLIDIDRPGDLGVAYSIPTSRSLASMP